MWRTEETKTRIDWTDENVLGDLNFTDAICLLNSSVEEMQTKTNCLSSNANKAGFFINASNTEVMRTNCDRKLLLNDKALADIVSPTLEVYCPKMEAALLTIWRDETRTTKGYIPPNHHKRGTTPPQKKKLRHKTLKEWLKLEMCGVDCSLLCASDSTGRE